MVYAIDAIGARAGRGCSHSAAACAESRPNCPCRHMAVAAPWVRDNRDVLMETRNVAMPRIAMGGAPWWVTITCTPLRSGICNHAYTYVRGYIYMCVSTSDPVQRAHLVALKLPVLVGRRRGGGSDACSAADFGRTRYLFDSAKASKQLVSRHRRSTCSCGTVLVG